MRRKRDLSNSCKPSKVRTYACNEDGYRDIKYFDYKFDFDEDMCVEKMKKRSVKCSASETHDDWDDDSHDSHDRDMDRDEDRDDRKSSRDHDKRRHKSRRGHHDD